MKIIFKHLPHSRIDTLSDGIFSIALTLLGFDLIGVVREVAESEDLTAALADRWPVFFSFVLGFLVLYSIWYQYHATSQYVEGTNALVIWQHGFMFLAATLIPFASALLGETINTKNMADGVFYFGVLIFIEKPISVVFLLFNRDANSFALSEDAPVDIQTWRRMGLTWFSLITIFGAIAVSVSFFSPWLALALYGLYLLSNVNPIGSLRQAGKTIGEVAGVKVE